MKEFNLFNEFLSIKRSDDNSCYNAVPISDDNNHRLGITSEGYPIFFIECSDNTQTPDINLKILKVKFNVSCVLNNYITGERTAESYTIIQLMSTESSLQKYFISVFFLVLSKLCSKPKTNSLKSEISKVLRLFSESPELSTGIVRGLWAELFVIEKACDPDYLINAWHVSPEDKYDFNDGANKLEVKSTSSFERTHTFSLEQLNPNEGSQLVVASVMVIQTGLGTNIFDLVNSIEAKISDHIAAMKLKSMILSTIGPHLDEVASMFFDYETASDNYVFFDHWVIPTISPDNVPSAISRVHFNVDLTDVEPTPRKDLFGRNMLFDSM